MEKYLRPGRFSTDPSTVGAEIEWFHWRTRFDNFFDMIQPPHSFCKSQQDVKIRDSIKLKLFLNHVTPNVYKLFCGFESCEEIITHLNNVYSRCDSDDVSARYKLANKKQQTGESLYAYVQSLRELARDCNFDVINAERNRDDYIRDVFISGIVSNDIRKKLLENSTLTLEESVNQAADLELEFQSANTAGLPSNSQEPENNQRCDNTNLTIQGPQISISNGGLTKSNVVITDSLSRSENIQHRNNRISPKQEPQISLTSRGLTKSNVVITDGLSRICQGQNDVTNMTMALIDTKGYSPVQQKSECFFCRRLFHVRSFCPVRNVTCHICRRHECPLMLANPDANICKSKKELRRKRAELSVALRKQARDEQLQKRRALSPSGDEDVQQTPEKLPTPQEIVEGLKSSDAAVLLKMARAARRILSREQNPPISIMIKAGVIKPLVKALDRDDCADLQFEASWALTNIASGSHEHTMAVIDSGVVPKLVSLAYAGGTVGEQCTWALGNIAGDGPQPRDLVLTSGALSAIIQTLRPGVPNSQLRTATWTFSNLCRNKNPLVNFDLVSPALPYIANLLEVEDQDVLSDSCWALSYLTDGPNERIEAVQAVQNLLKKLVRLLDHPAPLVKTPALRAVGNMLTGSDEQTDRCLDEGCLHYLSTLLRYSKPGLVKEAAWALSNILAGTQPQIQRAIDYGILPHLLHVLMHHDSRCQREAAWAITNLCLGGSPQQLDSLLALGFLEPYCNLLGSQDPKTITIVLDGITNLLQAAEKHGNVEPLCVKLEMIGALDRIESLQTHENEQIYKKVLHIVDVYFAEGDDETAQPSQTNEEYTFNINQENQHMNF